MMDILKIVETLQLHSENLTGEFAEAVTEAVSLLISQGEQIADLENKLAMSNVWVPVLPGLIPKPFVSVLGHMTDAGDFPAVRECYRVGDNDYFFPALQESHPISYWMPFPEPPKEV